MTSARTSIMLAEVPGQFDDFWFISQVLTVASDPNCGAAYSAAVDDTLLGVADGCSGTNPSNSAVAPSTLPSCS